MGVGGFHPRTLGLAGTGHTVHVGDSWTTLGLVGAGARHTAERSYAPSTVPYALTGRATAYAFTGRWVPILWGRRTASLLITRCVVTGLGAVRLLSQDVRCRCAMEIRLCFSGAVLSVRADTIAPGNILRKEKFTYGLRVLSCSLALSNFFDYL